MEAVATIAVPDFALVVLVGAHGSGKTLFAARHFGDDVLSRDAFRKEGHLHAEVLDRISTRRRVVVDAPHATREARRVLVRMAAERHVPVVALVFPQKSSICTVRCSPARRSQADTQAKAVRDDVDGLLKEGFDAVHEIEIHPDLLAVESFPSRTDHRSNHGPFDIVGDVHGCLDELLDLVGDLGYVVAPFRRDDEAPIRVSHPEGRQLVLLGDLVDRGPDSVGCLRLAMGLHLAKSGFVVPGNHDDKLLRALTGQSVKVGRSLSDTLDELSRRSDAFRGRIARFLHGLERHRWLDGGRLAVAHAGVTESMLGLDTKAVRAFCVYGPKESDGVGRRLSWQATYSGRATVVHGHVVVPRPTAVNSVIDIDTGCAYGGSLTALRWPEMTYVSVPARKAYAFRDGLAVAA